MLRSSQNVSKLVRLARRVECAFLVNERRFTYQAEIYTIPFKHENDQSEKLQGELSQLKQLKCEQSNLYRYIKAYHEYGFKKASIDPLCQVECESNLALLDPASYGLDKNASTSYQTNGLLHSIDRSSMSLSEIEDYLNKIYAGKMSIEFDYIQSEEEKHWIAREFERIQSEELDKSAKINILKLLLKSQVSFELCFLTLISNRNSNFLNFF
jgi:2-oxoglutarate dehydrogenase complex dehydrogenase (E1) component-like enzyme